ncbi:MAG: FAD-binding oxidoreductase [Opitutus sp.]|nr:FAD-binding oxidoreductase [Opitutus sp.]
MSKTWDTIVVGAGITGASTAYHLKKRGQRVLLLDRAAEASGGTGRSAAVIRQHYSTPLLVRLARESIDIFAAMPKELGLDGGYVAAGYCFLVTSEMLPTARRNVEMQSKLGIETTFLADQQIEGYVPKMNREGVAAVIYERLGGYADPVKSTKAFVGAFSRMGGEVRRNTPARALLSTGKRVTGVLTDEGPLSAGVVVNAAGPWAGPLAASAGLEMPMRTVREQDTVWEVPRDHPLQTVSVSNGVDAIYIRPLGNRRFVIGRGFPKEYFDVDPYNYKTTGDAEFIADVHARATRRLPTFADMRLVDNFGALYDVTPDWNPFIGPREGIFGYMDACGGSGHGFKIGPAIGRGLADWVVDGKTADDFRQLSHDRLAAKQLFVGGYGGNRA